jgi:putative addiction module component (TIGR02574 family)
MKLDPQQIIDEAMQLEPQGRALVAEALLESLDIDADVEISEAWRKEIRQRCDAIDQGTIALIPGDQVLAEFRRKYG